MEEKPAEQAERRVSVIIVSFNNAPALRRCLTALEACSDRNTFEILVVDNGSSDACPRIDAEFPSANVLRLPHNFGLVKALNIGMRTATGEYYLFLDPEMEVSSGAISLLAAQLDSVPEATGACPLVLDTAGAVLSRCHPAPLPAELQRAWETGDLEGWTTPDASSSDPIELDYFKPAVFLVRSYFLKGLNYIDERYSNSWWDLEICTQILRTSRKLLLVPSARVTMAGVRDTASWPAGIRGLLAADRALGAAVWCGKHYGWVHGFRFRLTATLRAFGAVLSLRDFSFRSAALRCLLMGEKLDGSL